MVGIEYETTDTQERNFHGYPINSQGIINSDTAQEALDYIVSKYS
jgi:hypothetical protein